MSLFRLFLLFVKIGAILLGGGYVILPVMKSEFVEKHKLISEDDLINYFAISQSLPGIIAANISIFVGYKLRRTIGAIAAVIGVTFAPFWSIVLLASIISKYLHTDIRAESPDSIGSCSDGVDNDHDGKIDNLDEGCKP